MRCVVGTEPPWDVLGLQSADITKTLRHNAVSERPTGFHLRGNGSFTREPFPSSRS